MPRKNQDEHRERMRKRSYEKSLSSRDIAPLPPVVDPARRARCRRSLVEFCLTYFAKKFKKPFGKHHLKFIKRLEGIIRRGGKQSIAMPRGTGKTTITIVAAIWALVFGYRRFVVIIAATKKDATKILKGIKAAVSRNPLMRSDFPEICHPLRMLKGSALLARGQLYYGEPTEIEWTAERVKFPAIPGSESSGSVVVTVGIGSAIRGQSDEMPDGETARPDLVILDDLQTNKVAKNPKLVDDLENTVNSTIEGLAEDGEELAMVMPCTVINEDDAADRYLNHEIYPHWRGLRFQMIEKWPDRMDLWREYRILRRNSVRDANAYYKQHMREMQAGAVVSWPESFNPKFYFDALHRAMSLWCDNERSFWAERQNKPLRLGNAEVKLTPNVIRSRLSGLAQGIAPVDTRCITAFVDVHHDVIYWVVTAWTDDFTGTVIDYGTFPDQRMLYFTKGGSDVETMMQLFRQIKEHGKKTVDGAILLGIDMLLGDLLSRSYAVEAEDSVEMKISRLLIDVKYKPEIVEAAIKRYSPLAMPARGVSVRATNKPMADWDKEPGTVKGRYWIEKRVKGRALRGIHTDTNHWKTRVHEAFALHAGERGGITLFGNNPNRHKMFSEHLCAEDVKLVTSSGREVYEWKELPNKPDNHFGDCIVGAMVAASTLGVMSDAEREHESSKVRRKAKVR